MQRIVDSFILLLRRSDTALDCYLALAMATMILPMVWLTWYYHRRVAQLTGGKALMEEQAKHAPAVGSRRHARNIRNMGAAAGLAGKIERGDYGEDVRKLQRFAYVVVAVWLAMNALVIGVPLWAVADFYGRYPELRQGAGD